MQRKTLSTALAAAALSSILAACASAPMMAPMYNQAALPDAVKVPAGNKVAMKPSASAKSPTNAGTKKTRPVNTNGYSLARTQH